MWRTAGGPYAVKTVASSRSLYLADLAATMLFAVEGGTRAAAAGLDLFGILVISLIIANGGGIVRDIIIGDLPPDAFRGRANLCVSLAGAAFVILTHTIHGPVPTGSLWVVDAAGLGLFAAAGAQKALNRSHHAMTVIALAAITGTGGGVLGDVLLNKTPAILTQDIYATAAALAGILYLLSARRGLRPGVCLIIAAAGAFLLRSGGVLFGWQLPHLN